MDEIFEIQSLKVFEQVTEEILENLYNTEEICINNVNPSVVKKAKGDMENLIIKCNFDLNKLSDILKERNFNTERTKSFLEILDSRKTELLYEILLHHNSMYGEVVKDFDWLLKLVIGTSELKTLKYPLLQLMLSTVNSNGHQKRRIYDVNKEVLGKLINELEDVLKI